MLNYIDLKFSAVDQRRKHKQSDELWRRLE